MKPTNKERRAASFARKALRSMLREGSLIPRAGFVIMPTKTFTSCLRGAYVIGSVVEAHEANKRAQT